MFFIVQSMIMNKKIDEWRINQSGVGSWVSQNQSEGWSRKHFQQLWPNLQPKLNSLVVLVMRTEINEDIVSAWHRNMNVDSSSDLLALERFDGKCFIYILLIPLIYNFILRDFLTADFTILAKLSTVWDSRREMWDLDRFTG